MTTGSHAFFSVAAVRSAGASCSGVKPFSFLPANLPIIPIEVVLCDVALDCGRQSTSDRLAAGERAPKLTAGHVRGRKMALDYTRRVKPQAGDLGWLWLSQARPVEDHQRGKL